jgi:hypothetical protein
MFASTRWTALANSFVTSQKVKRLAVALSAALLLGAFGTPILQSARAAENLPKAVLVKPSAGLLGTVDATSLATEWSKYYAPGLVFTHGYVAASSDFTLTWKVVGANGKPLPSYPVTLQANKAYGGNTASFSSNCIEIAANNTSSDAANIFARTNSQGLVSFQIQNTDALGEPASTPLNRVDQNQKPVYGQFSLQIGNLGDLQQAKEIVELHVIGESKAMAKPSCQNWATPESEYLKSIPVLTPVSAAAKPRISGHAVGNLIWSEEFGGSKKIAPNLKLWTSRTCGTPNTNGGGIYCAGDQYYWPGANKLDGLGHLVISTDRIASPQANLGDCQSSYCPFTSGRFDSQGKLAIKYGYLEARIQLPAGTGQNPAFWLLGDNISRIGWPSSGEIDVMEQPLIGLNQNAGSLHYSSTYGGCCANHQTFTKIATLEKPLASGFHSYGILWTKGSVVFYLDGQEYGFMRREDSATHFWPFDAPAFMIFDNSTPGDPRTMAWSHSEMRIDYVRLWKVDGQGAAWTH